MSHIDELVTELCPSGVTFMPLRNVARLRNGRDYKSFGAGDVPVYGTGGVMTYIDTYVYDRPSVLIPRKGSLDKLYYVDRPFWTVDTIFYTEVFDHLLPKFLYYHLSTQHLEDLNQAGGVPTLTQAVLNELRVPVPPLEVQREIVRILDTYTELEAELLTELEARQRQFGHFAERLLVSRDDVSRVNLGAVATIVRGASPRPIQSFITRQPDGIPWIKIGDAPAGGKFITATQQLVSPAGAQKSRRVQPGDFLLSNSMSFGRPYISKIEGCIHDGWLAISGFNKAFLPDYLYYLLRSASVQAEFKRRAGAGTVKNLNADIVKSVRVPLPPLSRQREVVELLDSFDTLVNDLSVGLPAELAARRKQYEHYRDRLLTFEEAPS